MDRVVLVPWSIIDGASSSVAASIRCFRAAFGHGARSTAAFGRLSGFAVRSNEARLDSRYPAGNRSRSIAWGPRDHAAHEKNPEDAAFIERTGQSGASHVPLRPRPPRCDPDSRFTRCRHPLSNGREDTFRAVIDRTRDRVSRRAALLRASFAADDYMNSHGPNKKAAPANCRRRHFF